MAENTRKRTGEFLRKLFEILMPHAEGLQARDALKALEGSVQLTEYEKGIYESGSQRFKKIVHFATVDCVKAGWLLKNKGRWVITEAGRDAYSKYTDPEDFYRRAVKLYHEWKASQPVSKRDGPDESGDEISGKTASITFEEA